MKQLIQRYVGLLAGVLGMVGATLILVPAVNTAHPLLKVFVPLACFLPIVSLASYLWALMKKRRQMVGRAWWATVMTVSVAYVLVYRSRFVMDGFEWDVLVRALTPFLLFIVFWWLLLQGYLSLFSDTTRSK